MNVIFPNEIIVILFDYFFQNYKCKEELITIGWKYIFLSKRYHLNLLSLFKEVYNLLPTKEEYFSNCFFFKNQRQEILSYDTLFKTIKCIRNLSSTNIEEQELQHYNLSLSYARNYKRLLYLGIREQNSQKDEVDVNSINDFLYNLEDRVWNHTILIVDYPISIIKTKEGESKILYTRRIYKRKKGFLLRNVLQYFSEFYKNTTDIEMENIYTILYNYYLHHYNSFCKRDSNEFLKFLNDCFLNPFNEFNQRGISLQYPLINIFAENINFYIEIIKDVWVLCINKDV